MSPKFENTLHYSSPAHGDWGVVRMGMLIPESYQLFVCPFACGRHGAIGARNTNINHRLSYLYVTQSDIIDGYDNLIVKGVHELLEIIDPMPKVLLIFVSCLDDLIATDHDAFLEELSKEYPEIRFGIAHMNPISLDSKTPPPISMQNNLYHFLDKHETRDLSVNTVGNLVKISQTCELHEVLKSCGMKGIRHISDYETFDGYQDLAKSSLNLVLAPTGRQAAGNMERELGIPSLFLPITYSLEEIEENYKTLLVALPVEGNFDLTPWKKKAQDAIAKAREAVKDLPIIVDATAVMQPFGLAKALLEYGFCVKRVEAQKCVAFDKPHLKWLTQMHPEVEVHQPQHVDSVRFDRRMEESLAIGIDGAYLANSRYVADLFSDEGMFGYEGVCALMELLVEAVKEPCDLNALINGHGLVV